MKRATLYVIARRKAAKKARDSVRADPEENAKVSWARFNAMHDGYTAGYIAGWKASQRAARKAKAKKGRAK